MRALEEIRNEIERVSDERAELWHRLSEEYNPALSAELHQLEAEIEKLWEEHRATRAALRFGDRERILQRARTEERIERSAA
jgi:archaellum component FlaC